MAEAMFLETRQETIRVWGTRADIDRLRIARTWSFCQVGWILRTPDETEPQRNAEFETPDSNQECWEITLSFDRPSGCSDYATAVWYDAQFVDTVIQQREDMKGKAGA